MAKVFGGPLDGGDLDYDRADVVPVRVHVVNQSGREDGYSVYVWVDGWRWVGRFHVDQTDALLDGKDVK